MSPKKKRGKERPERINVTFNRGQVDLIDLGVEAGMAFSRTEYIRKAVDKLNEEIPVYQAIRRQVKEEKVSKENNL